MTRKALVAGSAWRLAAAAALLSAGRDVFEQPGPEPVLSARARAILRREADARAEERKRRQRAGDDARERLLRQQIAEGYDRRADKYLHASARRRRAEASAAEARRAGTTGPAREDAVGTPETPRTTPSAVTATEGVDRG